MPESEYLTTREVADLLRLKERKVYDLAASESIPCTRATGKLLFPKAAITQWLQQHSSGATSAVATPLFSGSHDPLLEWAIRESRCGIATLFDGSVDGCVRVANGEATVAALHILDHESATWNAQYVVQNHTHNDCVLVRFATRSRGIVFSQQADIKSFNDMVSYSIAARQPGAGSQILLESLLSEHNFDAASLNVSIVARTESDAVLAITEGQAECTMGLQAIAAQYQLDYLHLIDEPLDLLVDRQFWFEPEMQSFLSFCRSPSFGKKVAALSGYRADDLFAVRLNN